jgi:hypothetical protein
MAPPPNCFLCIITYVIAQEKQRKELGSGTIADGETDAKNASVDSSLGADNCTCVTTSKTDTIDPEVVDCVLNLVTIFLPPALLTPKPEGLPPIFMYGYVAI